MARPLIPFLALVAGALLPACSTTQPPTNSTTATAEPTATTSADRLRGDEALRNKLTAAVAAKGPDYVPRTRHKHADGSPKYTNRLILESSPYLLQHAHNPVSWMPWGDEAFALAKELGRPVFLSVGYSTCHWCHVMEEESFEDEEIARFINDHYIPIKVDREERPDVDAIYMRAVQILTRRGGWPMSVWLTPDRKPFYAGTYFPPRAGVRGATKGFIDLLRERHSAFTADPDGIGNDAERLALQVQSDLAPPPSASGLPGPATVVRAAELAEKRYDKVHGGPRGAPKFPSSFPIRLLLRYGHRAGDAEATDMALTTLRKMQAGGIYDHVGGGFHRYSVDAAWQVPHFEKMLYDNALLSLAYLEGWQVSGDAELLRVARETLDYVVREMTSPVGGYYSATDADSLTPEGEREEGYYFTWTPAELDAALEPNEAKLAKTLYDVSAAGNFEGRNILNTPRSRADVATELGMTPAELAERITTIRGKLLARRNERPRPILDDKIQVGWNGLMLAAMARGARVTGDTRYRDNAAAAARFLLRELVVDGRLRHLYKLDGQRGVASGGAFAEDHAFLAHGLIEAFQATQDASFLESAIMIMNLLETHHAAPTGGYYRTANDHETLLARELETHDGAVPSAGSLALLAQLELWTLTTDDRWRQRAETTMRSVLTVLDKRPHALDEMMLAVDFFTDSPKEILIAVAEDSDAEELAAMLAVTRKTFVPSQVFIRTPKLETDRGLAKLVPWAAAKPAKQGKPTAYVCEGGACDLPTTDPAVFAKQLDKRVPYPGPTSP